jgi:hypothetical protein
MPCVGRTHVEFISRGREDHPLWRWGELNFFEYPFLMRSFASFCLNNKRRGCICGKFQGAKVYIRNQTRSVFLVNNTPPRCILPKKTKFNISFRIARKFAFPHFDIDPMGRTGVSAFSRQAGFARSRMALSRWPPLKPLLINQAAPQFET